MKQSEARTYDGALKVAIADIKQMHGSITCDDHHSKSAKCDCVRGIAIRVLKEMRKNIKEQPRMS
jgi:hypothetical protein